MTFYLPADAGFKGFGSAYKTDFSGRAIFKTIKDFYTSSQGKQSGKEVDICFFPGHGSINLKK
ncbi:hypothetical protein FTO70_10555 [Methanosarcina sp. KYL-1]|uniref:hypothetical protein n=1 Tax=Methanosarcina sp. KYL-1 TaxID=2602068 RepID=UPI0021006AFE|nr:hypothetical protein [Methanosarcina sp. KYL-1]MCQ1536111.1 hypothetical protein [Methanosarcina sp. KYL-1]